ncbi:MAG: energy-coupled thiamine transporter ThiT [Defluviitaleaceae bacterium]|nr:energy-coupled thiamine transporter ThiT [Defluviitaleaceae bacterium]
MQKFQSYWQTKFSLRTLVFCGLLLGIAFALSYIRVFSMPNSGSITPFSMFFVSAIGMFFGPVVGVVSGVAYGLLQLVQRASVIHPMQFILDYPLAFGMLGLSGFFWKMKGRFNMQVGFAVAVTGRFVMSTLAGWLYWFDAAPGSLWASMVYNAPYMYIEAIATIVVISLPPVQDGLNRIKKLVRSTKAA